MAQLNKQYYMKQRFKNSLPRHKGWIEQFWQVPKQMKKQNTNHNFSFLSPRVRSTHCTQQLQKTKTLKKHNYFGSQVNEIKNMNKTQESCFSNVLDQLACYVQEKNGQIPWTKKYNWQQMLVSSGKESVVVDDDVVELKRNCDEKDEQFDSDIKINKYQNNTNKYRSQSVQKIRQNQKQKKKYFNHYSYDEAQFSYKSCQKKQKRFQSSYSYKQQQKKQLNQRKLHQKQSQQSDTESLVDFLLKINKISQTQTFAIEQNHINKNIINNQNNGNKFSNKKNHTKYNTNRKQDDSDSDFEQLLMMVQRQQKRRNQKSSQLKKQEEQKLKQQQQKSSYHNKKYLQNQIQLQQIDSPIVACRRPIKNLIDDLEQQTIFPNTNHKNIKERYLFESLQYSEKQQKEQKIGHCHNKIYKKDNKRNHNKRSSQYKPWRLKKQRQQQINCTICMCEIEQRAKLSCRHQFCLECLKDWLQKTSSCPICRKDAKHYIHKDQKYKVQHKKYSLQNYVDNIGDDDEYDSQQQVDYQCENCQQTNIGDEIIICDRCLVNATHVYCDRALGGVVPPQQMNWYCSVCRDAPMLWFLQIRRER